MSSTLVMGLGGTVDYEIVWDSSVLEELVVGYAIAAAELDTLTSIRSERDLVISVLGFVRDGVGGERFVESSDVIAEFSARFRKRITLGGTAVRAAAAMRALGVTSTLHLTSINDHIRGLLPVDSPYICSATSDSTDPHLIIQYKKGATMRAGDIELCAPHPNRIIYTNDVPNRELVLSDELGAVLSTASVFLISGLNTMQDIELIDDRLRRLIADMKRLPGDALVVYEDAGFHVQALSRHVSTALVDLVDVHSMNEDELQAHLGRRVDLLDPDDMERALVELQTLIPARTLVVHTKYWSLALGERADLYSAGLIGGITMATTRYEHGDEFTQREYDAVGDLPVNADGARFAADIGNRFGDTVSCVPAFVVNVDNPTTIGLGDTFVGGFIAAMSRLESVVFTR